MKATEKAQLKAERNAEKALQLSQKGKRKALRSSTSNNKRRKRTDGAAASLDADAHTSAASTITTRRGRNITLPAKFK
jgi:regulator of protease activity HflC (stomatin/prohibitin superfamily)